MIDTLVWLVDDSNMVSAVITKDTLGPNAPIALDTTGLSILMPGLKKYPNKGTCCLIFRCCNQSQHLVWIFLSLHQKWSYTLGFQRVSLIHHQRHIPNPWCGQMYLSKGVFCCHNFEYNFRNFRFSSCPKVYLPYRVNSGTLHPWDQGRFKLIQVIDSIIDVKIPNLMKILNPLLSSARPQINNMLQQGMELNITAI